MTPLRVDEIVKVHMETDRVDIRGEAILFEKSVYAKLPDDMPRNVALSLLDVAGAAPQTARLVKPGHIVFILGAGGKSGMLCAYQALQCAGPNGMITGRATRRRARSARASWASATTSSRSTRPSPSRSSARFAS
jgi:L-erythro-3,5-diaminohexanoate dehydrogenase